MRTADWKDSVYSDGTRNYVSCQRPQLGDTVSVRLRMFADAPVEHVMLWTRQNGAQLIQEMQKEKEQNGLAWYKGSFAMEDPRCEYRFYLICADRIFYYTQRGIQDYMPDHSTSFVLLADYEQPAWVKSAVFYQIFPERFANGDPSNDVKSGEYTAYGYPSIHRDHWEDVPLTYEEGHCLDFHGGDLKGIEQKIPYLKQLGVTALYINPIFRGPSVHKYDCIDYFHVDEHFGGDAALASLSKALHENGMRLILDISINHTGANHKWFNRDGAFFDTSVGAYHNPDSEERSYYFFEKGTNHYKGWWNLDTLPTLNYGSEKLRERLYKAEDSVLKKWLKPPYSIDGWRFDVADVMARNGKYQYADEVWPEIRKAIRSVNPQAYILAEDWDECSERQQGDAWDSPMNYYGCSRVIRDFYGQPDLFLSRNPVMRDNTRRLSAGDVKNVILSYLAKMPYVFWQNQFNLVDSHDVPRFHNDPSITWKMVRGMAIFLFTLIGCPSVYYGDEAGIDGLPQTNEGCRYPMPWSRDITGTREYALYHRLIEVRRQNPAFSEGGMQFLYAQGQTLALARQDGESTFVAVISAEEEPTQVSLPLALLGVTEPVSDTDLLGEALTYERMEKGILLTLSPQDAYLFACR